MSSQNFKYIIGFLKDSICIFSGQINLKKF